MRGFYQKKKDYFIFSIKDKCDKQEKANEKRDFI